MKELMQGLLSHRCVNGESSSNNSTSTENDNNGNACIDVEVETASSFKVEEITIPTECSKDSIHGFRIVDTAILNKVFSMLHCPQCELPSLSLHENMLKKQGLSSLLYIKCSTCNFHRRVLHISNV